MGKPDEKISFIRNAEKRERQREREREREIERIESLTETFPA